MTNRNLLYLCYGLITGICLTILFWIITNPARGQENTPGPVCENGLHVNNPHCASPSPAPTPTPNPCENTNNDLDELRRDGLCPTPAPSRTPEPDAGIDGSKAPEPNGIDCTKNDCSVHVDNYPKSDYDNRVVGWK